MRGRRLKWGRREKTTFFFNNCEKKNTYAYTWALVLTSLDELSITRKWIGGLVPIWFWLSIQRFCVPPCIWSFNFIMLVECDISSNHVSDTEILKIFGNCFYFLNFYCNFMKFLICLPLAWDLIGWSELDLLWFRRRRA